MRICAGTLLQAGLTIVVLLSVGSDDVRAEPSSHLRLEILAIVYTDTFTKTATDEELERVRSEVDEARRNLWRLSRQRLQLDVDWITIDRHLDRAQFWEVTSDHYWLSFKETDGDHSIRKDLAALGYEDDSYDAVVVFYAHENGPGHYSQYGGATYGVNQLLGKAAYVAIPMAWKLVGLGSRFEHEILHVLSSIYRNSGYAEFPNVHNGEFFKTVYGEHRSWPAWLLDSIPDEAFFAPAGRWGTLEPRDGAGQG